MIMYLLLAMFPVFLTPIVNSMYKSSINKNDRAKKTFLLCCGAFIFIMMAFKNQYVGTIDSHRYYMNWALMHDMPYSQLGQYISEGEMESGYIVAVWLLSNVFAEPQMLFVLTGLFFSISVCLFIYRNSADVVLSVVMYVCLGLYSFMLQGIRQAIAMSICLFAFEYCKKKELFKFLLLVLLATVFHKSAIIFLAVYLINFIGFNIKSLALVSAGTVGYFLCSSVLANFANRLFGEEYVKLAAEGGGAIATTIYVLILGAALFFAKKHKKDRNYILYFYLTYIGLIVFVLRYIEFAIADRISFYFMFGQMILLPKAISNFDKKVRLMINFVVITVCILLYAYRLSSSDLNPYVFFWYEYPIK